MGPPHILPWAILSTCHGDGVNALIQLYEPYTETALLKSRPACLTFFDCEQPQPYGPGLYTSLHDVEGNEVMCNFLQLSPTSSPKSACLYAKRSFSLDPEITTNVFHQLCLEFSDIICVSAKAENEVIPKVLRLIDSLESGRIRTEPQVIILLGDTPLRAEVDEINVRKSLKVLITKERGLSPWTSGVLQHLVVRHYDPKRTRLLDFLKTIQRYTAAMRKRRKERSHLWAIAELDYLLGQYLGQYLSVETTFLAGHQNLRRPTVPWYPMAFRRRFWPGENLGEQNVLAKWMQATDENVDLSVVLAPIFASMFLDDGDLLPHGMSHPTPRVQSKLTKSCYWCRISSHGAFC